jgi:hypothetical protein
VTPRRSVYISLIERAWAWLEHWGHTVNRVDLSALGSAQLLDRLGVEQQRVLVLADEWQVWW